MISKKPGLISSSQPISLRDFLPVRQSSNLHLFQSAVNHSLLTRGKRVGSGFGGYLGALITWASLCVMRGKGATLCAIRNMIREILLQARKLKWVLARSKEH